MDEYKQEEGLSLGEIFKVIFKKIWLVLAITAGTIIVGVLVITFLFNPSITTYQMTFAVDYPGVGSSRYPDGTTFRYQDIVSFETLEEVKKSDSKFSSIDIEDIYTDGILISEDFKLDAEGNEILTGKYVIEVGAKYFESDEDATSFVRALADYPVQYAKTVVKSLDYNTYLDAYANENVKTYEEKINYLALQRNYITGMYDNLISTYGESYKVEGDSTTLSTYRSQASMALTSESENYLRAELEANLYVFNLNKTELTSKKEVLDKERKNNEKAINLLREERDALIEKLQAQGISGVESATAPYDSRIAGYLDRNVQIDQEMEDLDEMLASLSGSIELKQAFEAKLDGYANALETVSDKFKTINIALYNSSEAKTIFDTATVEAEGNISLPFAGVISLLLGFIIGSIVVCIMDLPKYIREKRKSKSQESRKELIESEK